MTPLEVLQKYWKYESFRKPQEEIVNTILENQNVIALLPTGAGKSLCFQIPTLLKDGVCIVVSPLIALMQDQVNNLKDKNIKAITLNSSQTKNEQIELFDNLRYGGYKFLYLSPERLQSEFIQEKIRQLHVSIIAIDEAHCISEWGHDFRPSYLKIRTLREIHPGATTIAVTASATEKVKADIIDTLELKEVKSFRKTLKRPELEYSVVRNEAIYNSVKDELRNTTEPTIIYASSRKATKNLHQFLSDSGFKTTFFHGGLTYKEKQKAYKNWLSEKKPIIIATNAFGMGIDKNNVKKVIHVNLPFSIENYVQETGRAGRNGQASNAILFYNEATIEKFKKQFVKGIVSLDYIRDIYKKLNSYFRVSYGEKPLEEFQFSMLEFCSTYKLPYLKTYSALDLLEKEGILEFNQKLQKKSTLKFITGQNLLFNYCERDEKADKVVKLLLRSYGGLFENYKKVDEQLLAAKLKIDTKTIVKQLKKLSKDKIIDYKPITGDNSIRFLVPREDNYTVNKIARNIKQRYKIKEEKFIAVLNYIKNNKECRSQQLLTYFNEQNSEKCGTCDVCLSEQTIQTPVKEKHISQQILDLLSSKQLTSRTIINELKLERNAVLSALQLLLDNDKINLNSQQEFQLKN